MTVATTALVAVAGAVGALVRHEVMTRGRAALRALHVVNVVGALAAGLLATLLTTDAALLVAAGGMGGLTSFSTWMVGATDGPTTARDVITPTVLAIAAALLGLGIGTVVGAS